MSPPPDVEKYRRYVDKFDLPEERKIELIHTVWQVVEGFAYRAFGLDPVQQVVGLERKEDAVPPSSMLDFNETPQTEKTLSCTFEQRANDSERRKK